MMPSAKILIVFGTRPEVIKLSPIVKELRKYKHRITTQICVTAQHRQLLDPFLKLFRIKVDYDLNIMQKNQSLEYILFSVMQKLGKIIKKEQPDFLLVQGDTTTSMAASLAAFYQKIKIIHVEAGLRTKNKLQPYPEEINRKIIDSVSDLYFAHSQDARQNLLLEGVSARKIEVTGNTVIDALFDAAKRDCGFIHAMLKGWDLKKRKIILVTAHRRENFGQPLINICRAIKEIALKYADSVLIIYPVHLNPNVYDCVYSRLSNISNVLLIKPLGYLEFIHLVKISYFLMTDSGGLQEEAPNLGKPVLILREITERAEVVLAGSAKIAGTNTNNIIACAKELLEDKKLYMKMAKIKNPYGDGKASKRIVKRLLTEIKISK